MIVRLTHSAPGEQPGMVWIPGGEFTMGSDSRDASSAEKPAHRVRVDGFWMDETDVINAQFRMFDEATGYVTTAERTPTLEEIMSQAPRGAPQPRPEDLVAGSVVFKAVGRSSAASATASTIDRAPASVVLRTPACPTSGFVA